ncbi:hypothetical protein F4809DRAFT_242247 [Biscogniauxia mediterranea]|nr:hypothetical protein F4809DRAFT_242247 [Biscogniauxia mediterranea]
MRQRDEGFESSSQLLSKEIASSAEGSDYHDPEAGNRFTQYIRPRRDRIWQRISPILISNWSYVPNINKRYLIFSIVVSLIVTAFIFNPYVPQNQDELHVAPVSRPGLPSIPRPNKENYTAYERPKPKADEQFCTTWPVDKNGNYEFSSEEPANNVTLDSLAPEGGWKKPEGVRVVAMVFYGRKRYVDILDCYLRQNLASSGGYLDEVWFMAHTQNEDDTAWVEDLVLKEPDYKIIGQHECENQSYSCLWNFATADNTIYIKIDDDIIFIHPDAISQLVHTRLAVPHPYAISANLVNSPMSGMEHYHFGAIHAFVPDPRSKPARPASETWRPSELGSLPPDRRAALAAADSDSIIYPPTSPYRGHGFVLVSEEDGGHDLLDTAMGRYDQAPGGDFIAFSPPWKSWVIAAQQHYSLLRNLETNQVQRYFFGRPAAYPGTAKGPDGNKTVSYFSSSSSSSSSTSPTPSASTSSLGRPAGGGGGGEQVYDTGFRRYNLNFCAVWGADVAAHLPIADDDEADMTDAIPKRTGRPFAIDTRAVVAHFSFATQAEGMARTDLLDRWRAYANEAVCRGSWRSGDGDGDGDGDGRRKPWDLRCPDF